MNGSPGTNIPRGYAAPSESRPTGHARCLPSPPVRALGFPTVQLTPTRCRPRPGEGEDAMTSRVRRPVVLVAMLALVGAACTGGGSSTSSSSLNPSASHEPVTITVWDYYGTATPFSKDVIQAFEEQYPWITVDHQAIGYEATHDKFTVSVSGGAPPDLATIDMTWIPTFASNGLFANVSELSGGQINGKPIEQTYSQGALDAMTFDGTHRHRDVRLRRLCPLLPRRPVQAEGHRGPDDVGRDEGGRREARRGHRRRRQVRQVLLRDLRQRLLPLVPVPVPGRRVDPERGRHGGGVQRRRGALGAGVLQELPRRRVRHLLGHGRGRPDGRHQGRADRHVPGRPVLDGVDEGRGPRAERATGRSRPRRTRRSPGATSVAPACRSR